jgi:hypothetical protein
MNCFSAGTGGLNRTRYEELCRTKNNTRAPRAHIVSEKNKRPIFDAMTPFQEWML